MATKLSPTDGLVGGRRPWVMPLFLYRSKKISEYIGASGIDPTMCKE